MREKPIIFSAEMVKAILDGRKTQTRRVIKTKVPIQDGWVFLTCMDTTGSRKDVGKHCFATTEGITKVGESRTEYFRSRYQVGDRLWVRENICTICYPYRDKLYGYGEKLVLYNADGLLVSCPPERDEWWRHNWHIRPSTTIPSIHMPKWATRLWLEITDVRAERLQDISEADAKAEGSPFITWYQPFGTKTENEQRSVTGVSSYRTGFAGLWDSIDGKRGYSWETNPYVFAYTFEKVK